MSRDTILRGSVALLLLALATSAAAPGARAERFRLLSADDAAGLERRLEAAAADGFRFLAVAQGTTVSGKPRISVLVERAPGDAERPRYRAVACADLLGDELRATLERLGGEGYALAPGGVTIRKLGETWLPGNAYDDQMTLIFEKRPAAGAFTFDAIAFADFEPFYRDLQERREQGYEVAGMWNAGRRLQVVFQKASATHDAVEPVPRHRLLFLATRRVLATRLERAAGEGYRALAAVDPSTVGPPVILLERSAGPGNALDYRFLDDVPVKQSKEKLERKLNRRASKGWRVAPHATTHEVITLQRIVEPERRPGEVHYRLLSSRVAPGLPGQLEEALAGGYELVRLFVEPDETTVLVERIEP